MNSSCGILKIDESCLFIKSGMDKNITFQTISLECEKCELQSVAVVKPQHNETLTLDFVSLGTAWKVIDKENNTVCGYKKSFLQENAEYVLDINSKSCSLSKISEGTSVYLPLIIAAVIYFLLVASYKLCEYLYRHKVWNRLITSRGTLDELAASYSSYSCTEENQQRTTKQRLRSLDTVRGIAVVIMIFVNYGGGKYWFFHHARWNGLTVADLVFPWFIWMMGMSMALSLRSLSRKSVPRKNVFYKIVKRSVILFALGIMYNTVCLDVDLNNLRLSGVLQRFSICYFIVGSVHLYFTRIEEPPKDHTFVPFHDVFLYWPEWLIMITFLVVHTLFTFLFHRPGCLKGYLGPGGFHNGGQFSLCTGGAAGYVDQIILGSNHLYQHPTIKSIYHTTVPYDPEGILGYLTSTFLVFLGLQAGKILLTHQNPKLRIFHWLTWAFVTGVFSMILCKLSKNDGWIPVNKNLWSISYIFATGSFAFVLISFCYYVIDVKQWWTGGPFFYSGMNSILLYIGQSITHQVFPWSWQVADTHAAQLAIDLWGTSLWVIISVWAYNIDFFVTI